MSQPTTLVVSRDLLTAAASSGARQPLFGLYRPAEALLQILSRKPDPSPPLRRIALVNSACKGKGTLFQVPLGDGRSVLLEFDRGLPTPSAIRYLEPWESLDDRRRGLLPNEGLSSSEVHLIGAGSLGSAVGVLLAQAGVGRLRVYDRDWLDTPNLVRHTGNLVDLGREKSQLVAEQLSLRGANALGVTVDLTTLDDDGLDLLLKPADVVVCTTDSPAAQFSLNEAIVRRHKSAVFAGAYELACAGEVLAIGAGAGPCLFCATGFRTAAAPDLSIRERRQAYQSADERRLESEPGLAIDITYLATITAAHVLALLDPVGSRGVLTERGGFSLYHGPSAPRGAHRTLFRFPLESVAARVVRDEACPVCGFVTASEVISA